MTDPSRQTRLRVVLAAGIALVVAPARGAEPEKIVCPAAIAPPQPAVDAPPGWDAYWSGRPKERLRGLEVVHGGDRPPLAFLAPSVHNEPGRVVGRWDLRSYANEDAPIWIYCQYENTALRLARALPRTVRFCMFNGTDNGDGKAGFPLTAECQ
jgi:hypothetical protein